MNKLTFLSCDWGTTAFRLRLVDAACKIIEEEKTALGIAETFQQWKNTGKNEEARLPFYLNIIDQQIKTIEKKINTSLQHVPLIISGMASSTIGMVDLPYKNCPFNIDGSDLQVEKIEVSDKFKHDVSIISGVRTEDDVMRGEETKLIGCFAAVSNENDHVFIFPGTHPKHVNVKDGKATGFKTYMTGEIFDLLSKKSVLSVSVEKDEDFEKRSHFLAFEKGVNDSTDLNILHACFLVRTNNIFNKLTKQENYYYLSGLLIGTELKDLRNSAFTNITIAGNEAITPYYTKALHILGLPKLNGLLQTQHADEALIRGQLKILGKLGEVKICRLLL